MADMFISYAREEAARAEEVRRALEALGLSVFFDVERLDAGDVWSDVIDRELKSARVVVGLWSPHALSRPWVKKECAVAQGRGVLIPALLEPVTDLDVPTQFSDLQRVDLTDFHGAGDHPGWRKLVRALAKMLKRNDLLAAQIEALKEEKQTAKVKAELEAAQKELAALRKSKGGVKPAFVAAGLAILLVLGAVGSWLGMELTAEQTRASIVDPEVIKALSAIPDDEKASGDRKPLLENTLKKVKLGRLQEASKVDADAALLAGWAFMEGIGTPKDESEAVLYIDRACSLGNTRACGNLGSLYEQGLYVEKNLAKALSFYTKGCDLGDAGFCANLGFRFASGSGVVKNPTKAISLFNQACDGGIAIGCHNLAVMYETGSDVGKDPAKAAEFYAKACDGAIGVGCNRLGMMYESGSGVEKNPAKADTLFIKACDLGDAGGCAGLGLMYAMGSGVAKDPAKAASFYAKACDGGDAVGCAGLGVRYANGEGVQKDEARAQALFKTACDGGVQSACNALNSSATPN